MEKTVQMGAETRPARWGLYGDWPWRLMRMGVRLVPGWLERPIIAVIALLVLTVSRRVRRSVGSNLAALCPQDGILRRFRRAWRTLFHFGCVSTDSIRASMGQKVLRWEVEGTEFFAAAAEGGPVILLTAHMGCYDAAASCFADRMGSRVHAVRMPERSEALRRLREQELGRLEGEKLRTRYNEAESMLGVELLKALRDGEWAALQADRALPGLSIVSIVHGGLEWSLPRGPFVLAMMSRASCLPVLTTRTGHRRYRVTIYPPFTAPATRDRDAAVQGAAEQWLDILSPVLREAPEQWLVFEPLVSPAS